MRLVDICLLHLLSDCSCCSQMDGAGRAAVVVDGLQIMIGASSRSVGVKGRRGM